MSHARLTAGIGTRLTGALVILVVGALVACSSPAASSPSGDGDVHTVTISGSSFGDDLTISAGSSVVFVNEDPRDHTVTNGVGGVATDDPLFDVQVANGSTSDPITFDEPGTYDVTCRIHPSMEMTITVE